MKKLFLMTSILMLSLTAFAENGNVICEDRTTVDNLEQLKADAIEAGKCLNAEGAQIDCPDGAEAGSVISN